MRVSKLGFKRLWRLVEHMQSLPASANKHFRMVDYIGHRGNDHQHAIPTKPTVKDLHACGTTACALGWAMTVPSFRRAGLTLEVDRGPFGDATPFYFVHGSDQVFGLDEYDEDTWDELFGADNKDRTPKIWAKRVSKLLRKWEREKVEE